MLNREQIIQKLKENHKEFACFIGALGEQDFMFSRDGKWTPGQQADHIRRSIKPVNFAFSLPKSVLRLFIGKSNRPSKTFEALYIKYRNKLAEGGKASGPFIPKAVAYKKQKAICNDILKANEALIAKVAKCSEEALDVYILPHPLLGKVTLREMLYFNIFHVKHHYNSVHHLFQLQ